MKSSTCFGKQTGQPLTEYDSESEAGDSADYARMMYEKDMEPYHCSVCDKWHLSPKDRKTPSSKCLYCVGGDGYAKALYRNKAEALQRAKIIHQEQGKKLFTYQCEHTDGWHLTKSPK
jgi:hypothetical protein